MNWDWDLPAEPYVPGKTPRPPDDDAVHRIAGLAPDPTAPDAWASNTAWLAGIRLYEAGYYWEAHEVWEPVWINARPNSRERKLVQAVIQLANAALKQAMRRDPAARRLAAIALALAREVEQSGSSDTMGLAPSSLARAIERYRDDLDIGPDAPAPPLG